MSKIRIQTGDLVEVIAGESKGARGQVQRILARENKVVVAGVNVIKKHQKARPTGGRSRAKGGIIEFEAPVHISNVMLVCPQEDKPTRIGVRRNEEGQPVRYSKRSGKDID